MSSIKEKPADTTKHAGIPNEQINSNTLHNPLGTVIEKNQLSNDFPKMHEDAFPGILNSFIEISRENSEASAVAVAANAISYFCAKIGRKIYQSIGDGEIHCRPFFLLVGNSGKARKGTSEYLVNRVFEHAETLMLKNIPEYKPLHIHSGGLSSGEGIAYAIRDASDDPKSNDVGVEDKRVLVIEPEFANVLAQCKRETNILSSTIRNLFDGKTLAPLTKTNRTKATDPHVVIVGHITQHELLKKSGELEASNGFLNRFILLAIHRDQLVPLPEKTPESVIHQLAVQCADILLFVEDKTTHGDIEICLSEEAKQYWKTIYPILSEEQTGLSGALMARTEMYARMLAMIFCLLEKKVIIEIRHIRSALCWIDYFQESVKYIFERGIFENKQNETRKLADKILGYIKNVGISDKTAINRFLSGHVSSDQIDEAIDLLLSESHIEKRIESTKGKHKEIFTLLDAE